ncbi:hypothetical protein F8568_025035 [Actinomadura sp. LD22]|uniref:Uncharacterized protein n=1 Tax=Actinomadura physcomitrii TaxID=2650748 RepID=A0A6I4MLJ5_9ACTN|nr:hypothetical protein [Actinomadura physcomitrii]MWA03589.1 hypothetical protein [Actinomadura physcomitrii]
MSVFHDFTAAPRRAEPADRGRFTALLGDLLDAGVIGFPACVLAGDVLPSAFSLGTILSRHLRDGVPMPPRLSADGGVLTVDPSRCGADGAPLTERDISVLEGELTFVVHYAGSDARELCAAVERLPFDSGDVAVHYPSQIIAPKPGSPSVAPVCDAGLFATVRPRALIHTEAFALGAGDRLLAEGDPAAVQDFPVNDTGLGCQVHPAYWYLEIEGKGGHEHMAPTLRVCRKHFGDDCFSGWTCG